jgi:hypothetical protein
MDATGTHVLRTGIYILSTTTPGKFEDLTTYEHGTQQTKLIRCERHWQQQQQQHQHWPQLHMKGSALLLNTVSHQLFGLERLVTVLKLLVIQLQVVHGIISPT